MWRFITSIVTQVVVLLRILLLGLVLHWVLLILRFG